MSTTADQATNPGRPGRRARARSVAGALGLVTLIAGFSVPAAASAYPGHDSVQVTVAIALLPVGVYLVTRLYPNRPVVGAVASLFVPVGSFWAVSGYVPYVRAGAFSSLGELAPHLGVILGGLAMLAVGTAAAAKSTNPPDPESRQRGGRSLMVSYLVPRSLGAVLIGLAALAPLLVNGYRNSGIAAAPIILGLFPAGAFLVTRPAPRRANAAVAAALLLPAGSVAIMSGVLAGARPGAQPDAGMTSAGLILVAGAITAAWSAWGSPLKTRRRVVAQTLAIIVWAATATLSIQAVAEEPAMNHIAVIGLEMVGSDLYVEVPFQGGCAPSHLTVRTELIGDTLEVLVTEPAEAFHCLAGCLAARRVMCTEVVQHRLESPPPAGTILVAASRPATGLLRLPWALVLAGLVAGAALWNGGKPGPERPANSGNEEPR